MDILGVNTNFMQLEQAIQTESSRRVIRLRIEISHKIIGKRPCKK